MKKNVSNKIKQKKIAITKKKSKDSSYAGKERVNTENQRNNIIKNGSFKEISIILNNNLKNSFKSKSKEKKKINRTKDFIDENQNSSSNNSPIKFKKIKNNNFDAKNSNLKSFMANNIKRNITNRFNISSNKNNSKEKKKVLIYNIDNRLNSNYNLYSNNNNFCLSNSSRFNEEKRLAQEEILEFKLINSRLKNEIKILVEKNKSLNEILEIKKKDIEILKNKNDKLYNESNDELIKLKKKYESDMIKQKNLYERAISIIKSLINTIIELCEAILTNGSNAINYTNTFKSLKQKNNAIENNSLNDYSLDIYEGNNTFSTQDVININKDEEKRYNLLKQIKEIIIEKINFITKELNLILDISFIEKIDHIRSWNFQQIKSFPTLSFLMSNIKKNNANSINNISLNDDYDFSVSKSFLNHSQEDGVSVSPKFNNSSIRSNNSHLRVSYNNKMPDITLNESKSLFGSFNEIISNNKKENENKNKVDMISIEPKKIINILEYSMVNLNDLEEDNNNINNKENKINEKDNKIINNENKENSKIIEIKNNNFVLNSLSFNNELLSEKNEKENCNALGEENKLLFEHNKNNNITNININLEDKNDNNLNNFTLKNI